MEHPQTSNRAGRKIKHTAHALGHGNDNIHFTPEEVLEAIRCAKSSTAIGPDDLATIMLKHIGPNEAKYLAHTFNTYNDTLEIPDILKLGKIVPVPKSGKPAQIGES